MTNAQTATLAPPMLTAEGEPVLVVTPDNGLEILQAFKGDFEDQLKIMNWMRGLRAATFYDDPAEA